MLTLLTTIGVSMLSSVQWAVHCVHGHGVEHLATGSWKQLQSDNY
jgi:hypothetical protein